MRPKKPVLLYCADQELLSATAFVLRLHSYDVAAVNDSRAATLMISGKDAAFSCGVLIHSQQGDPAGRAFHQLLETASHVPLLLVDRVGDLAPLQSTERVLYGRNVTMAHILAALHVLCRRKRGSSPRGAA